MRIYRAVTPCRNTNRQETFRVARVPAPLSGFYPGQYNLVNQLSFTAGGSPLTDTT